MKFYSRVLIKFCHPSLFPDRIYPERSEGSRRLGTIFCLFLLLTTLTFKAEARRLIDKSVMTVNDDTILESDVDKFQKKIQSKSYQELFGGVDERALKDRDSALQLLVEEKIINQQVKKLELTASDQEVHGQIAAILKRNNITEAQLEDRLKQLGTTMADYREGIRRQIERRNLVEREIKPSMEVSEEQLRHYYMRHTKPEDGEIQYKIAHILVENKIKGGLSPADRAKKVYAEVSKDPATFDALVKDVSDDTSTASTGGVLGFYSTSQLAKEFRNLVPKTPVGHVTEPIKTSIGYHIVKVLEEKKGDFSTLPRERREALLNQMKMEEVEKRMSMWLERKKNEAFIHKSTPASNPVSTPAASPPAAKGS
jgi:parvulin-like peptidyl-prolyl isomerase